MILRMIFYYYLFKTTCRADGSAFFGIHRTTNPRWIEDGAPIEYVGTGEKLRARVAHYGMQSLDVEVLQVAASYDEVKRHLDRILTPATLADPLCLNMPRTEINQRISEGLTGKSKSPEHKEQIAVALAGNLNALAQVMPETAKKAISESKKKIKWWHNTVTQEEVQLEIDEEPLTGFALGRLPKAK